MDLTFLLENFLFVNFDKSNYLSVETFLTNSCFLLLLITTLYYWIRFIFFSSKKNLNFDSSKQNASFAQKTTVFEKQKTKREQLNHSINFGFYGLLISNIFLFIQLSLRWIQSGHFPLSNLYESLLFLAWGLLFVFIILEKVTQLDLLGIIISPSILCLIGFTDFSLPDDLQEIKPLVPALQSNWLFMHVSVMIFSYAALIIGSLLSISFLLYFYFLNNFSSSFFNFLSDNTRNQDSLLQTAYSNQKNLDFDSSPQNVLLAQKTSFFEKQVKRKQDLNQLDLLDNLSYRLIGIGFCFLTLGILSGAIWANETWGTYWSWDPKETWALITWLVFAIYLHTRLIHGLEGVKSAWIAFCGFIILWVCYLGVNLLGQGLHSYGFLDS